MAARIATPAGNPVARHFGNFEPPGKHARLGALDQSQRFRELGVAEHA
jgi:hypothetical protein